MSFQTSSSWKSLLANLGPNGHAVQLYQTEEFFGDAVSHFAAEGLVKRESLIIVATESHWDIISSRLTHKGFDIEELRRHGQLTVLDADATLPKFMDNDMPDARTFKGIAGATIEKARAGGRYPRVRWWGEMVNVLYVDGNSPGSIRLEELFDEVAHEESIAIFCSFRMDKFDRQIYDGPLQNVCRTHAHLIPAENYECHRECVDRAVAEVFSGIEDEFLDCLASSKKWSGPEMPTAQALLLWLKESSPYLADRVLELADHYEQEYKATTDTRS